MASSNLPAFTMVHVTVPDKETGHSLAKSLVESQLAACVNIVPGIESVYRWQGDINVDKELLLIIKTKTTLLQPLTAAVKELHPYDEPEVVAVPVLGGSPSYLAWVADSTRAK